ncbi:aldo/keto reductase [Candidatus Poribacteria bacterium]|nr:aldo/keto reductase [Candidatus Poribacteria bacterium]
MNVKSIANLPLRRLGRTNVMVTPVGIGGAALSHGYTTPSTDEDAVAAVNRAAELGIAYIDTSPGYGESERRIGLAFKNDSKLRKHFFLATKTGTGVRPSNYTADWTYRSVENSLKLLNTDWIDLMQIHDPANLEPALAPDGALTALRDLKKQGVIRAIGLGVRSHEFLLQAIEHGDFDTILTYADFNLVRQTARDTLFPAAEKHDVGIVLGSPILFGLLSNRAEEKLERHRQGEEAEKVRQLSRWARERKVKLMSLALQYCLREPRVSVMIVGTRNVEQVEELVSSVLDPLPENIWEELERELGIR